MTAPVRTRSRATGRAQSADGAGRSRSAGSVRPPHHRRAWPYLLAFGLLAALVGGGLYVLYRTPLLAVQEVQVNGASDELAGSIRAAAAVPVDTPLIQVDLAEVAARVEQVPQVDDATVTRNWPDALLVTVTLRLPVAVTLANGSWWLLDSGGLPYLALPDRPAGLIPIELATPGPDDPSTTAAIAVLDSLPEDLYARVTTLIAASPYDVTLVLEDGRSVIWGDASNAERKAQVLPAVLARVGTVFDVSDPSMVTVR